MKGKTKKIVLAVAVIGAIAAGGVAFTEANTVPDSVAGYKTTTVSGATVTKVAYTLNSTGDTINDVILTFSSPDVTNLDVKIGFNGNAMTDCTVDTATQATCSGLTEDLTGATALAVAVTGTP
jgi:Tfp pilus assembly protein PilV